MSKTTLLTLLSAALLVVLASAPVQGFEVTDTIILERFGGYYGLVYNPERGEIFLTNGDFHLVYVISDSTHSVVATIPVGHIPSAIAYNPVKGQMLVTNFGSDTVSVISASDYTVTATIPVGIGPWA
ncbi:MAG: hypothetical protein QXD19_06555 [Candidatus Bathyarchaeia archaeon]